MRYLGVDYGHKRIGLAVSDADGKLSVPLKQLPSEGSADADARMLAPVVEEYTIDVLIVGLPLMEDGREGEQSAVSQTFAQAAKRVLGIPVELWDERYTTSAADHLLKQREELTRKKRKARRDALAAQTMLQSYLDSRQQPRT